MDPTDTMITTTTNGNQHSILQAANSSNEANLSATAKDDDDVTVQTSNSTKPKQAWKTYYIKLLLTSKQDTSDSALQHAMLTILEMIDQELGIDTKILMERNSK
jgi:hypothetical protein